MGDLFQLTLKRIIAFPISMLPRQCADGVESDSQ